MGEWREWKDHTIQMLMFLSIHTSCLCCISLPGWWCSYKSWSWGWAWGSQQTEGGTNIHLLFWRDAGATRPGHRCNLPLVSLLWSDEFYVCFLRRAHVGPEWMSPMCGWFTDDIVVNMELRWSLPYEYLSITWSFQAFVTFSFVSLFLSMFSTFMFHLF